MNITGNISCTIPDNDCDFNYSFPCGKRCWTSTAQFEYTFKGERFQIYGTYDPEHRNFDVYLDDKFVANVDQHSNRLLYQLQYTSDIFPYGKHTIKVIPYDTIELFKFTYFPSVKAKRINITEFEIKGNWETEMDNVGGYRMSTIGLSEAFTNFSCSKFWIYGTLSYFSDEFEMSFGNIKETINLHITTGRKEGILLYESDELTYMNSSLHYKINSGKSSTFYCVYYIDEIIPISVPVDQMKFTGVTRVSENVRCPSNVVSPYPCCKTVWYNPVSHSGDPLTIQYTFKGEKFQKIHQIGKFLNIQTLITSTSR